MESKKGMLLFELPLGEETKGCRGGAPFYYGNLASGFNGIKLHTLKQVFIFKMTLNNLERPNCVALTHIEAVATGDDFSGNSVFFG